MSDNYNSDDDIRLPDDIKFEKLIGDEDYYNNYNENYMNNELNYNDDNDIQKAIDESLKIAEKNDEDNFQYLIQQMNERKLKYENIINKFKKVIFYDNEVKEIYELINWIIEYYINMQLEFYKYDKCTYNKIFNIKILKQIRLNDEDINILKELILIE